MAKNTTITINLQDSTLYLAETAIEGSRAGMPDIEELSSEQLEWFINKSFTDRLDIISMTRSSIPGSAGVHDFWYHNPWVSSDVILQMVHEVPPIERGLAEATADAGAEIWYYPRDYPNRLAKAIENLNKENITPVNFN